MQVEGTYKLISVDADAVDVVIPLELEAELPSGVFLWAKNLKSIVWSPNLSWPIAPGVIPDEHISLFLPKNYKHDLKKSDLSWKVVVYVHRDNIFTVPPGRPFKIWNEAPIVSLPGFVLRPDLSNPSQVCDFATRTNGGRVTYSIWAVRLMKKSDEVNVGTIDTKTFDQLLEVSGRVNPSYPLKQKKSLSKLPSSLIKQYTRQNIETISQDLYVDVMKAADGGSLSQFDTKYRLIPGAEYVDIDQIISSLESAYPSLQIECVKSEDIIRARYNQ